MTHPSDLVAVPLGREQLRALVAAHPGVGIMAPTGVPDGWLTVLADFACCWDQCRITPKVALTMSVDVAGMVCAVLRAQLDVAPIPAQPGSMPRGALAVVRKPARYLIGAGPLLELPAQWPAGHVGIGGVFACCDSEACPAFVYVLAATPAAAASLIEAIRQAAVAIEATPELAAAEVRNAADIKGAAL